MAELRVTVSKPIIRIQPDEFAGKENKRLVASDLLDSGLAEFDVLNLKRARVTFTLEASGLENGTWNLELLIALRGGQVHARALPGAKESTDFSVPLSGFISMLTHPDAGGSADMLHKPKNMDSRPRPVLIPVGGHKGSVLFACPSGEALLSLFHEIRDYAPVTVDW
jgi:hypothetical protein